MDFQFVFRIRFFDVPVEYQNQLQGDTLRLVSRAGNRQNAK